MVVWDSYDDTYTENIEAQRLDSSGAPVGSVFRINSLETGYQWNVDITRTTTGEFVVAWESAYSGGDDNDGYSIQARRLASDGTPLAASFQVNDYITGEAGNPEVDALPDGGFVVAWNNSGGSPEVGSEEGVQVRRFDSSDQPLGPQIQVDTFDGSSRNLPAIATSGDGAFMTTWEESANEKIKARVFDSVGNAVGDEFEVGDVSSADVAGPEVVSDPRGRFLVVWDQVGSRAPVHIEESIQARWFDSGGTALTPQFQINTVTTEDQDDVDVAMGPEGQFIVVFQSDASAGTDSAGDSAQARLFAVDSDFDSVLDGVDNCPTDANLDQMDDDDDGVGRRL